MIETVHETRISFATYPEIPLVEARQRRQEARAMLAHGDDPGEVRKAAEKARSKEASLTFKKIAKEWHTAMLRRWQPGTAHDIWYRLEMDILPASGDLPIGTSAPRDILQPLRKIEERGALEMARRDAANVIDYFTPQIPCVEKIQSPFQSEQENAA